MTSRNEALQVAISGLQKRYEGPVFITGEKILSERWAVPTGQEQVDKLIGGFSPGINLIIGGPSVGKSLLTAFTAAHEVDSGRAALVISSEEPQVPSWFTYFPQKKYHDLVAFSGSEVDLFQALKIIKKWFCKAREEGVATNMIVIDSFNGLLTPAEARTTLERRLKGDGIDEFSSEEVAYASLAQVDHFLTHLAHLSKQEKMAVLMTVHDWNAYARRARHQVADDYRMRALGLVEESEDENHWPASDYDLGIVKTLLGNASSVCRLGLGSGSRGIKWVQQIHSNNGGGGEFAYYNMEDHQLSSAHGFLMGIEVLKSPLRLQKAGEAFIPFSAVPGFAEFISKEKMLKKPGF